MGKGLSTKEAEFSPPSDRDKLWFPKKSFQNKRVFKLKRYIFPSHPIEPPKTKHFSNFEVLNFLVNFTKHRIPPKMYEKFNEITQRDVALPEVYQSGFVKTKHTIKKDKAVFKRLHKATPEDSISGNTSGLSTSPETPGKIIDCHPSKIQTQCPRLYIQTIHRSNLILKMKTSLLKMTALCLQQTHLKLQTSSIP